MIKLDSMNKPLSVTWSTSAFTVTSQSSYTVTMSVLEALAGEVLIKLHGSDSWSKLNSFVIRAVVRWPHCVHTHCALDCNPHAGSVQVRAQFDKTTWQPMPHCVFCEK